MSVAQVWKTSTLKSERHSTPFYRQENQGSERLSHMPTAMSSEPYSISIDPMIILKIAQGSLTLLIPKADTVLGAPSQGEEREARRFAASLSSGLTTDSLLSCSTLTMGLGVTQSWVLFP